jgi:hypothetical protein
MPIRKDDGRRWVEMELLVPGTPEQVRSRWMDGIIGRDPIVSER